MFSLFLLFFFPNTVCKSSAPREYKSPISSHSGMQELLWNSRCWISHIPGFCFCHLPFFNNIFWKCCTSNLSERHQRCIVVCCDWRSCRTVERQKKRRRFRTRKEILFIWTQNNFSVLLCSESGQNVGRRSLHSCKNNLALEMLTEEY